MDREEAESLGVIGYSYLRPFGHQVWHIFLTALNARFPDYEWKILSEDSWEFRLRQPKSGWRDARQWVPQEGQVVLVATISQVIFHVRWTRAAGFFGLREDQVLYWMPEPSLPETLKQQEEKE